jgi:thymidylate synthase
MKEYHQALELILEKGKKKTDRTGVGTISVFGYQMRFDLSQGFPAVTTKKLAWKAVVSELLWFLEGSGDERRLAEILYGDREARTDHGILKPTIWTANSQADYWKPKAKYDGDLGRVYGVQWRHWQTPIKRDHGSFNDDFGNSYKRTGGVQLKEIDQIKDLINNLKEDPHSRRHIITAWNPGELPQMALPPCHILSQFDVTDGKLSCQLYQRSCDFGLGIPFNIASYSLLTHMLAQICNFEVGEFVWTGGDCHIYQNHIEQIKEQLTRTPFSAPKLIMPEFKNLEELLNTKPNDYILEGYKYHPSINMPMAV